jgi:hypothetical protein
MSPNEDKAAVGVPATRFVGTLMDILDRVKYARVNRAAFDHPIFKLRYEAYRREESVPFNDLGIVMDDLDTSPNAMCYGVYIDGELVSSLRLHHLTSLQREAPSMKVYPDVLTPLLDRGLSFIDPTRFTTDRDASLAYPALPFLTLRIAVMATEHFAPYSCLALVRPVHAAFYRRVFGSVAMSETRSYPGLAFPVQLYGTDTDFDLQKVYQRFPFFLSTSEEREALFSPAGERGCNTLLATSSRTALERRIRAGSPARARAATLEPVEE